MFVISAASVFADDSIAELDTWGDKLIGLIKSKWVNALLTLALVIEFGIIAYGNAQGEGAIFKKVLPWTIGTVGIMAATSITSFFMSD
jgi:hypothetical protein